MYWRDECPTAKDGGEYDGFRLLELVRAGESPFSSVWDVNLLIREIEDNVDAEIVDMPLVNGDSNNYQVADLKFEAAVYEMLRDNHDIKASRLLCYRAPAQCGDDKSSIAQNIVGRRLMVFDRKEGLYRALSSGHDSCSTIQFQSTLAICR
ncbi:hypothetical protein AC579_4480 [Pseudocercospora musae]|uniref:Uncharacterized protein n=1 Tax=Pseudocercospora musae TaxID=113226 RepID=A0A139H5K8_9PEZI|nr:hypothetical protein AC579_4480 [Pseudocercospora musae]